MPTNKDWKNEFEPVKSEMYQLLLCAYCYERKLDNLAERLQRESRVFLLEEVTALRHLSNGVILHLCNLDDENSEWSIRAITKVLGKRKDTTHIARECSELMKKYRSQINDFKTKHRNQFIAHRNGEDYPNPFQLPDYREDFKTVIQTGLSALQKVWGADLKFGFHLGSRDPSIDFKDALGLT